MDSKLNDHEISALQSLYSDNAGDTAGFRDDELPRRLFSFNLVTRHSSGKTVLTKHGERALFREACLGSLRALAKGEAPPLATSVRKWLLASGFIADAAPAQGSAAITPRGELWLASFEKDAAVVIPELTASDFAVRRA